MKNYKLSRKEFIRYIFISYILSFLLLYLFFYSKVVALIFSFLFSKILFDEFKEKKLNKESRKLKENIIFMLESLSSSLKSGSNIRNSFIEVEKDTENVIDGKIFNEIKKINMKVKNNENMEDVLIAFKNEMDNEYITLLVDTIRISYKLGGNINEGVGEVLVEVRSNIEFENILTEESESGYKELVIMIFLPILVRLTLRSVGDVYVNINIFNILLKTLVMLLTVFSFKWGKKIIGISV